MARPLSPHLTVYRAQLTSALSLLHRASGLLLVATALGLSGWLLALAAGPAVYAPIHTALASLPGRALLVLASGALWLHLANGLRHLLWDLGIALSPRGIRLGGWLAVAAALLLTALTWWP